jgi:D-alanyl-D-alanine carboxypeptidase
VTTRVIAALVSLAITASGCQGDDTERRAEVTRPDLQRTLEYVRSEGAPGVAALVRNRSGTWRGAAGSAVLNPRRPMRVGDRFRIASVTKTFVATVVLQLVGEGRLKLDDTVERRLPGALREGRRITVRQLLNHTSGIYNFTDDKRLYDRLARDIRLVVTPREAVSIADSRPLVFAPGTGWAYSNTGYQVLGLIIERVTGHPLGRVLAERIFEPLRLTATSFEAEPGLPKGIAHGYALPGGELPVTRNRPRDVTSSVGGGAWADGAIVSNVDDVASFYGALLSGKLVRLGLLRELRRTVPTSFPSRAGLGVFQAPQLCGHAWGHSGGIPGYVTQVLASKDGSHVVVVAANGDSGSVGRAVEGTASTIYCLS